MFPIKEYESSCSLHILIWILVLLLCILGNFQIFVLAVGVNIFKTALWWKVDTIESKTTRKMVIND